MKYLKNIDAKKSGIFAAGVLFGTAGIKILNIAAKAQDNAGDIYAEAQQINEKRAAEEDTYGQAEEKPEGNSGSEEKSEN